MGGRWWLCGICVAAATLCAILPQVTGTGGELAAEFLVVGPQQLQGDYLMNATLGGALCDARLGCSGSLALAGDLHYVILAYPFTAVKADESSPTGAMEQRQSGEPRVVEEAWHNGTLIATPNGVDVSLRVVPGAPLHEPVVGGVGFHLGPPIDYETVFAGAASEVPDPGLRADTYPPRLGWLDPLEPLNRTISGSLVAFMADASIALAGDGPPRTYHLGKTPSGPTVPAVAGYSAEQYEIHVAVVRSEHANATLTDDGLASWFLGVSRMDGRLEGDMEWIDAWGKGRVDDQPIPAEPALLQFKGVLTGRAEISGDAWSWRIAGPITFIGVDGQTIWTDRARAVGVVAGIALAALILKAVSSALSSTPLFSAYTRTTAIAGRRVDLLRAISEKPGQSRTQLAEVTGLSRTSVMHHLRVLEGAGLIEAVGSGKIPAYVLNSGTTRFALPRADAPLEVGPRSEAAYSAIQHPIRSIVRAILAENPAMTVAEIRSAWPKDDPPSPQTVAYHLRLLESAEVVSRLSGSEATRWQLDFDEASHEAHRRRAFLVANNLAETVAKVSSRDAWSKAELESAICMAGVRVSQARARQTVDLLAALGALRRGGDGRFTVAPEWAQARLNT